jgi:predicted RNase H-like nuclease (RuvC/YqgF family)
LDAERVASLEKQVQFLTLQLVERERVLQREKDEFIATVNEVSTRQTTSLRARVGQLEAENARLQCAAHERPCSPGTPPPSPKPAQAEDELRRKITELETRCERVRAEWAQEHATVIEREREVKKLDETAKRLSNALRENAAKMDRLNRELADEKMLNTSVSENTHTLEQRIDDLQRQVASLMFENQDAERGCRLMAQELLMLRPHAIEMEVWRLWLDTETRKLARVGKEMGTELFIKATLLFLKKYREGEAEAWVQHVSKNRNEALGKRYAEDKAASGDADKPTSSTCDSPLDAID